jgi:2-phospho-L-lactate/phosphoenolpyruvate guanylyltransferase
MSCWALVPVKARGAGKRRLADALDEEARAALVQAMLEHVLAALRRSPAIERIAVMTPDQDSLPADIQWIGDVAQEVNQSLRAALEVLTTRGATRAVVLSADLPFVTAAEVGSLLAASEAPGIALAPDRHGSGTNAVALALPSNFQPHFGPGSLARHVTESARSGLTPAILHLPGLEFDLDDAADLTLLRERADPRYTLRR